MHGWIKLHRQLAEHWVFEDPWKLRCWLDICLSANYLPSKVTIGMTLKTVRAGQLVTSYARLAKRWKCSTAKARRLMILFEKDGMIDIKSETAFTIVTICNWDTYQQITEIGETPPKRKRNAIETIKESKERKKDEPTFLTNYKPPKNL
jgi:hypothetical protein